MPHLRFRAVNSEVVQTLSSTLPQELSQAMNTDADNFTFESVATDFFSNGQATSSYPFVEVLWFERTQEVQNLSATVITDHVKKLTAAQDVVVVFIALNKKAYYENGKHF